MPSMVLKLHLSKAYDRMSWLYLKIILIHIGMSLRIVNSLMGWFSSVSFAMLINGSASKFFTLSEGLRQCCAMSPFLFLLVVEGLSRAVKEHIWEGAIKAIKIGKTQTLSHLLFADDVILFGIGTMKEAEKDKEILDLSCRATGMEVNMHKPIIMFSGMTYDHERR
jgi:hypothetical protein